MMSCNINCYKCLSRSDSHFGHEILIQSKFDDSTLNVKIASHGVEKVIIIALIGHPASDHNRNNNNIIMLL